jgi:very-short-patch-repair endonuclease
MRQKLVDAAIAHVAGPQHGLITTAQLRAAGLDDSGIARRVRAGRLHRIHRGVYAVGHAGLSQRGWWKAAITRPRRTLEDLRSDLDEGEFRNALRRAEFLKLPLDGFTLGTDLSESELERMFLALCKRHRIPRPATQVQIGPYRVDFLWQAERLIVETDGYGAHRGSVAFEADRARDNHLAELGYEVRRFTYRQVADAPAGVANLVRSRLRARRVSVAIRQ